MNRSENNSTIRNDFTRSNLFLGQKRHLRKKLKEFSKEKENLKRDRSQVLQEVNLPCNLNLNQNRIEKSQKRRRFINNKMKVSYRNKKYGKKQNSICPKAPHNTSQFLISNQTRSRQENSFNLDAQLIKEDLAVHNSQRTEFCEEEFDIDSICIPGGSMKGILLNNSNLGIEDQNKSYILSYFIFGDNSDIASNITAESCGEENSYENTKILLENTMKENEEIIQNLKKKFNEENNEY
jgi:hypothetical protein